MRCAVIDIGTNSVKLLIAEAESDRITPVWEETQQTRLGEGFYQRRQLQMGAIEKTAHAVARFVKKAKEFEATAVRVVATSAARDAVNREEFRTAVFEQSGASVEVISGEQEADWVFDGVRTDPTLQAANLLILDLGGGSTEFILGDGQHHVFRQSFAMGTVRLLEEIRPADPPQAADWARCRSWLVEFLHKRVQPLLGPHLGDDDRQKPLFVGTGGTTSILAAMELQLTAFDRTRIERVTLTRDRVWEIQRMLWGLPLAERQRVPGLPPNRADVILFGVAVFAMLMETFAFREIRVSTRGLRFGALLDLAKR
jgi:exopolyphosphatase/guanosine-5'-triphosphate,3'-diphosphate pyrophosphatase